MDLTVKIEFKGIYENELFSDELELSWFGRHFKN